MRSFFHESSYTWCVVAGKVVSGEPVPEARGVLHNRLIRGQDVFYSQRTPFPGGLARVQVCAANNAANSLRPWQVLKKYLYGIRCLFDPWIRDPGRVKSQDPDPGLTTRIISLRA